MKKIPGCTSMTLVLFLRDWKVSSSIWFVAKPEARGCQSTSLSLINSWLALTLFCPNHLKYLRLKYCMCTFVSNRQSQTRAHHVSWGAPLPEARLPSAVAVPGDPSGWPSQCPLHCLDRPRHGVQADRTWGGEHWMLDSNDFLCVDGADVRSCLVLHWGFYSVKYALLIQIWPGQWPWWCPSYYPEVSLQFTDRQVLHCKTH